MVMQIEGHFKIRSCNGIQYSFSSWEYAAWQ